MGATPYDLTALYESRFEAHAPHTVFLRMLYELYGEVGIPDAAGSDELGLTQFQRDGVWRAKRIVERRGGVIVADEVGLGKTFIAGELIREAAIERRQKVLLVTPATLARSTWRPFLTKHTLPADVVSYEELRLDIDEAGATGSRLQPLDAYALIVIDEAHNLRNPRTLRADALRRVLGGAVPKQVVLLTATPVNNSLLDVKTLISYISSADAAFVDVDVPSLSRYFADALALDPDELSPRHLFDVLNEIAVRRTRQFIKRHYPDATVNGERIVFPTPAVPKVEYDLDEVFPGFFLRLATALGAHASDDELDDGVVLSEPGSALTMARYVPSHFSAGAAEQYEVQNAGLLRSALLKRFESSAVAFANTLNTMRRSNEEFLGALDEGFVLTGDALRAWVSSDTDDVDAVVASLSDEARGKATPASDYDVTRLREAVASDIALLGSLRNAVGQVSWNDDPKVSALIKELGDIANEAAAEGVGEQDIRDRRKVLVFTYFADTAQYLFDALGEAIDSDEALAPYRDRLVLATGADQQSKQDAIIGFAPRTAGKQGDPDLYDLAVATDVLSEGVNLQQARHIINYDLPWNPMRLVQRHGRIDRIGSKHVRIYLRCFFPDKRLEDLLGLEERLQRKLKQAAAAFGRPEVLPDVTAVERVLSETRAEIELLRHEDASLFDDSGSASASSEEYQRRLAKALESMTVRRSVLDLPWGAGSGLRRPGSESGIVFCARIADHPRPQFRFVPLDAARQPRIREDGQPDVLVDLLTCLYQADPQQPDEPADLPESLRDAAFDAWAIARDSIHQTWMLRTDPKTYEPSVPLAMRDAAELVSRHGTALGDEQDRLVRRLRQDVDRSVQPDIRAILRTEPATDAVLRLKEVADLLRLTPPRIPPPLPPIKHADIRLICWVAVHG